MLNKQLAFVFPGQGSQKLGMLADLSTQFPIIGDIFTQASDTLGYDVWQLAQTGPEKQLNSTEYTQPVLLTASVALWHVWQQQTDVQPAYLAGHSLGEYSALVCAKALDFNQAVQLVALRGKIMQQVVPQGGGAMAAIIGLDDIAVKNLCQQAAAGSVLTPANFNSPGQVVIAGEINAVQRALVLAKEHGAKRALPLPVSIPSHCALMQSAAEVLDQALADIQLTSPKIPVIHNYDVQAHQDYKSIKQVLVRQLYSPVRWVETIQYLVQQGVDHVMECGPSNVLSGLNRRIDKTLQATALSLPTNILPAISVVKQQCHNT